MNPETKVKLRDCNSMQGMLDVLSTDYDLTKPLSTFEQGFVLAGLDKAVSMLKPELKKKSVRKLSRKKE